MTQEQLEGKINDVIAFTGADREQAVAALRAAFFDVNTAVNYVFEGIPANLAAGGAPAQPQAGAGANVGANQDGDDDDAALGDDQAMQEIQALMQNPQFQAVRQQILANPQLAQQILPQFLGYLQQNSPIVFEAIQQTQPVAVASPR
eukprot:GABU01004672.1.p2 GENE.GABU01004672.1~~GABU01004672.1.p2  ORF type:complete len:167 (-),score=52.46 GABU01004672.1:324-764(-)